MKLLRSLFASLLALLFVFVSINGFAGSQGEATSTETQGTTSADLYPDKVRIEYSDVFDVEYHNNYKIVTISQPWPGAEAGFTYLLVQRGTEVPASVEANKTIEIPVRSIVTMSTSYLPHLEMLGLVDTLVGHDAFAWVTSETILNRIDSGAVAEVGSGPTVNVESLIDMEPDLIMTYGMGGEWDSHPKLEEAKLPYVINAEWNEQSPLGRAEWLKFMAVFFNKESEVNEQFESIVDDYTALAEMASSVAIKPTVFTGAPYQGTWWVSGGGSYAAQLLADAGADYVWSDDDSTGSLMLDIESVFELAGEADFWINVGYWNSLADAKAADDRFANFSAHKQGTVYNYNNRLGPNGGNDYLESGPANPHKVLADLIDIFHPGLLSDHELYYYKRLE